MDLNDTFQNYYSIYDNTQSKTLTDGYYYYIYYGREGENEIYHCYRSSMCDVVATILPEWHIKDGKWYKMSTAPYPSTIHFAGLL